MMNEMKRIALLLLLALAVLCSCGGREDRVEVEQVDTLSVLMTQIRQCSRLYSAEYMVRKIVTHDDNLQFSGEILQKDFSVDVPMSRRKVAIPISASVKAYIDFSDFSPDRVSRHDGKIEIFLPDPKIMLTATRIDHDAIRQYVPLIRSNFSDEELSHYEQQGRQAIINDIAHMGIIETARQSAASTLIPMLSELGYDEQDITITFRRDFGIRDIPSLIVERING